MAILSVSGLTVRREKVVILDAVDWEVRLGEQWVILGPNGSGKTSLLSALTGYLTPTAGEIDVLGRRYGRADWRELRKCVGMVSSSIRQLIPEEDAALDIVVGGKYAMIGYWGKVSAADRRRALRLLRQVDCAKLAGRPWRVLSQGERQRLLIGRALMASPALLILDEPCAGLDPVARERFLEFIERLGRLKTAPALVLVTHHVEEITPAFTHVLMLKEGRVCVSGPKSQALNSRNMTRAFGAPVKLRRAARRYALTIAKRRGATRRYSAFLDQ